MFHLVWLKTAERIWGLGTITFTRLLFAHKLVITRSKGRKILYILKCFAAFKANHNALRTNKMLRKSTSKEGSSLGGSRAAIEDLKEDVKEEPASPENCESETCNADVDVKADKKCVQDDKRRTAHTVAEQKRRDAIKKGYDDLQSIVPLCRGEDSSLSPKLSKAVVLQKTIDHLRSILEEKDQQEQEIDSLKKEVLALQIMKANYEQIAKSTYNQTSEAPGNVVTDEAKFNVFKRIMDAQFSSFNDAAHVTSFSTLSASIFKWLEEECKPQKLQEIVVDSLQNTNINGV